MAVPFPNIPISQASSRTTMNNLNVVSFGNGYEQRMPLGINYKRDKWSIVWGSLTTAQKNTVVAFIDSVSNGSVITWTSPLDTVEKKFVLEGDWMISNQSGTIWSIQLTLRQVYDLS